MNTIDNVFSGQLEALGIQKSGCPKCRAAILVVEDENRCRPDPDLLGKFPFSPNCAVRHDDIKVAADIAFHHHKIV